MYKNKETFPTSFDLADRLKNKTSHPFSLKKVHGLPPQILALDAGINYVIGKHIIPRMLTLRAPFHCLLSTSVYLRRRHIPYDRSRKRRSSKKSLPPPNKISSPLFLVGRSHQQLGRHRLFEFANGASADLTAHATTSRNSKRRILPSLLLVSPQCILPKRRGRRRETFLAPVMSCFHSLPSNGQKKILQKERWRGGMR